MLVRLPITLLLVLAAPLFGAAGQQPASRVHSLEVERTPFITGPLKITLTRIRTGSAITGPGSLEVQVENTSTDFAIFSPALLYFVNRDSDQVNIRGVWDLKVSFPAMDRKIAPGARIKDYYNLSGRIHFPTRLYYDEKLLALIAE